MNIFKQRNTIVIIVMIIVILLIGYYIFNTFNKDYDGINEQEILISKNTDEDINDNIDEIDKEELIKIHITGCVKTPGVIKLKEGSRIQDAIDLAGGLSEDADITNINLAFIINDGMKIKIPSIYEKENEENENEYITQDSGVAVLEDNNLKNGSLKNLVNINTATQTELESLTGIGPSLASKIIEYRQEHGKFKTIEDIKNVSGIGDNKFKNIKDYIKV